MYNTYLCGLADAVKSPLAPYEDICLVGVLVPDSLLRCVCSPPLLVMPAVNDLLVGIAEAAATTWSNESSPSLSDAYVVTLALLALTLALAPRSAPEVPGALLASVLSRAPGVVEERLNHRLSFVAASFSSRECPWDVRCSASAAVVSADAPAAAAVVPVVPLPRRDSCVRASDSHELSARLFSAGLKTVTVLLKLTDRGPTRSASKLAFILPLGLRPPLLPCDVLGGLSPGTPMPAPLAAAAAAPAALPLLLPVDTGFDPRGGSTAPLALVVA